MVNQIQMYCVRNIDALKCPSTSIINREYEIVVDTGSVTKFL